MLSRYQFGPAEDRLPLLLVFREDLSPRQAEAIRVAILGRTEMHSLVISEPVRVFELAEGVWRRVEPLEVIGEGDKQPIREIKTHVGLAMPDPSPNLLLHYHKRLTPEQAIFVERSLVGRDLPKVTVLVEVEQVSQYLGKTWVDLD